MAPHGGGLKRSSQLAFRRRLLLVRLLLRGPATSKDLVAAVQRELGAEGYPAAAVAALKHDLTALKVEYGCQINYRRHAGGYFLEDLGDLTLLDLPDSALEALSFLDASFPPGAAIPELMNVRLLLDQLLRLLPVNRQEQHQRRRAGSRLTLPHQTQAAIDPGVLRIVKRAIDEQRELSFFYWSVFDLDEPRLHRVAPYTIFFRPEGHAYLDATVLQVTPIHGEALHAAIDYRLDRIVPGSVKALPTKLPPQRLTPPGYTLRYQLLPVVARRRDVAAYFPETMIIYHDDGSATVTARVSNLWQTRQVLLRYGDACTVLEPPELVELFRRTARGLATLYDAGGE